MNTYKDVTEDDVNCNRLDGALFFTDKMIPYNKADPQKIQRDEQQTKGAAYYLGGQRSTNQRNIQQGNVL